MKYPVSGLGYAIFFAIAFGFALSSLFTSNQHYLNIEPIESKIEIVHDGTGCFSVKLDGQLSMLSPCMKTYEEAKQYGDDWKAEYENLKARHAKKWRTVEK